MKVSTNRVVMKAMIIQLVFSCLLFSCSNNSREKSVDSSELSNIDYRLFQKYTSLGISQSCARRGHG